MIGLACVFGWVPGLKNRGKAVPEICVFAKFAKYATLDRKSRVSALLAYGILALIISRSWMSFLSFMDYVVISVRMV